jgi:hypothetical protein
MPDVLVLAGALMVAGPAIGTVCLSYPPLWRVWTVPREEHLALVAGHRRAWTMANVGFTAATVLTAGGLVLLAGSVDVDARSKAILMGGAVAYAIAGTLWCAVVAIRTRTTPALAALVAAGSPTEPAETLIGSATGGLYSAFMLTSGIALAVIGSTLALGGGVAAPVAWTATILAAVALAGFFALDGFLPAAIYLPTLIVGLALLLGLT